MPKTLLQLGPLCLLATLAACSSEESLAGFGHETAKPDAGTSSLPQEDAATPAEASELFSWKSCPGLTREQDASCSDGRMPLFHAKPDGESISFQLRRFPAENKKRAQLWLLQGGPGFDGLSLRWLAALVHEHLPDLEILLPDHRGTSGASRLQCAQPIAGSFAEGFADCGIALAETLGETWQGFNVTEAASDVVLAIDALKEPDIPVYIFGASYGGHWLHRILQLDTGNIDAAIFDSTSHPIAAQASIEAVRRPVGAGDQLLAICEQDAECKKRFGPNARTQALDWVDQAVDCELTEGIQNTRAWVQDQLTFGLKLPWMRGLVLPLLYRMARCESGDRAFFQRFMSESQRPRPGGTRVTGNPVSMPLFMHITLSEVMSETTSQAKLNDEAERQIFAERPMIAFSGVRERWPKYELSPLVGKWAKTDANVLVMHGNLDTQAPQIGSELLASKLKANAIHSVVLAGEGHGLVGANPDGSLRCGAKLFFEFLQDTSAAPADECADAPSITTIGADAETLQGVAPDGDLWDNASP